MLVTTTARAASDKTQQDQLRFARQRHSGYRRRRSAQRQRAAVLAACRCCGRDLAELESDARKAAATQVKQFACPKCMIPIVQPADLTDDAWRKINLRLKVSTATVPAPTQPKSKLVPLHLLTYNGSGGMFSPTGRRMIKNVF